MSTLRADRGRFDERSDRLSGTSVRPASAGLGRTGRHPAVAGVLSGNRPEGRCALPVAGLFTAAWVTTLRYAPGAHRDTDRNPGMAGPRAGDASSGVSGTNSVARRGFAAVVYPVPGFATLPMLLTAISNEEFSRA